MQLEYLVLYMIFSKVKPFHLMLNLILEFNIGSFNTVFNVTHKHKLDMIFSKVIVVYS